MSIEAVLGDPDDFAGWTGLGLICMSSGTVRVNGKDYTKQKCFEEAIRCDFETGIPWASLGQSLKLGEKFTLGASLRDDQTVTFDGETHSKRECLLRALHSDPNDKTAWSEVAGTMRRGETVTVNGKQYTKMQCYDRAKAF